MAALWIFFRTWIWPTKSRDTLEWWRKGHVDFIAVEAQLMFHLTGRINWIGNKSYNVAITITTTPKIGNSIHSKNFFISLEIYGTILHWYCCHVWICAPNCYLDLINYINCYVVCCSCTCSLRQKCPNAELFLVRIFLYSDWIRRFTPQISVFSTNTGKYGPEITPYLRTFYAALLLHSPPF